MIDNHDDSDEIDLPIYRSFRPLPASTRMTGETTNGGTLASDGMAYVGESLFLRHAASLIDAAAGSGMDVLSSNVPILK